MTTPAPVPFPLAFEQRSIAEHFGVWIEPAELHFNAAHFITYAGICENLHGHNFHVRLRVHGDNTADAFVVDFVELTQLAREVCATLHDRVLLPGQSREVRLTRGEGWIEVNVYDKRFVLPEQNCAVLPVANTTAEMSAWHMGAELLRALGARERLGNIAEIEVAVEEADRQWGVCRRTLRDSA
ncbi:MAG: 6-pyruvoyl trahydropterin synthase family protein [Sulfurifustis sp.]